MQKHPLDQLYDRKRELLDRVRMLEEHQRNLRATNPPRIRELSQEADRLATIFRPLLQQSQEAYAAGDGAMAKELSIQGREIEAQCKALNAQVSALRKEMDDVRDAIIAAKQEIAALNDKIQRYDRLRHIAVDGFEQAHVVSAQMVGEELSVLPARLLRHIKRVTYAPGFGPKGDVGLTANKEENPEQTTITLFLDLSSIERTRLEASYRHTIVHEAGHVLFDWVMSATQRFAWGVFYNNTLSEGGKFITSYAARSRGEDFGECFHTYIHNPRKLLEYDEQRYNFIDAIYKEVNA